MNTVPGAMPLGRGPGPQTGNPQLTTYIREQLARQELPQGPDEAWRAQIDHQTRGLTIWQL